MNFSELSISLTAASGEFSEILIAELSELGYSMFSESDSGLNAYILTDLYSQSDILSLFEKYESLFGKVSFNVANVENKNWNEEWERSIKPLLIGGKCLIKTSFHTNLPNAEFVIEIDPKMAFGTGHHPTTELCLMHMLDLNLNNTSVLDLGCGTGILAILAAKKGAVQVEAVDYDELSVDNTLENIKRNHVPVITVRQGTPDGIGNVEFDLVVANINRNILTGFAGPVSKSVKSGGLLILSGFYDVDEEIITKAYAEYGFEVESKLEKNNWLALMLKKCR